MYFNLLLLIKDSVKFQLSICEDCVPVKQLDSLDTVQSDKSSDSVEACHHSDLNSTKNKLEETWKTGCWQMAHHKIFYPPSI